jgi:hypothetical protein
MSARLIRVVRWFAALSFLKSRTSASPEGCASGIFFNGMIYLTFPQNINDLLESIIE